MWMDRVGNTPALDLTVHGAGVQSVSVLVPGQVMDYPLVGGPGGQQLQVQAPGLDAAIIRASVEHSLTGDVTDN